MGHGSNERDFATIVCEWYELHSRLYYLVHSRSITIWDLYLIEYCIKNEYVEDALKCCISQYDIQLLKFIRKYILIIFHKRLNYFCFFYYFYLFVVAKDLRDGKTEQEILKNWRSWRKIWKNVFIYYGICISCSISWFKPLKKKCGKFIYGMLLL